MQQQPILAGFHLSPQQKRLLSSQADRLSARAQVALLFEGQLDTSRLTECLENLVERHEILRTTFPRQSGMKLPFQVVNGPSAISVPVEDVRQLDADAQARAIDEALASSSVRAETSEDTEGTQRAFSARLLVLGTSKHILVITLPALCADSAALDNIVNEVVRLYAGTEVDDPLQYADYSEWQNELSAKTDEESSAANAFWREHAYSDVPSLVLPFVKQHAGTAQSRSESVAIQFDEALVEKITATGDPTSFLFAAWQILLSRLSGQAELVVGRVSSGRRREEFLEALGLYAKILPEYATFEEELSFSEVFRRTAQQSRDVATYEDFFPIERTPNNLTAGFSVEEILKPQKVEDLTISVYRKSYEFYRFGLELRCKLKDTGCSAELVYDPARFGRDTIESMAGRLVILLAAAAANPTERVSALPIIDDSERRRIVATFNETSAEFSRDKTIHQLFEEQVARTPDRPALRCGDQEFTYGELNTRANQIAALLRSRGVNANVPVGLLVERSADMILGILGIVKAGGCYVPLLADNPKSRLAHQLSETGAPVVLTHEKLLPVLPEFRGEVLCLDRDQSLFDRADSQNPAPQSPDSLVYVIYTSGSTGIPKGVAVSHSNLVNYSEFICRRLGVHQHPEGFNFATVSTISADLGNTCVFPSLISGGCLHVIDYQTAMDASLFAAYTEKHPIDVLKITPSHLSSLLDGGTPSAILPRKYLFCGGEALSWSLVDRIRKSAACEVINHYGPTEGTVGCCTFAATKEDVSDWLPATVPVGKPIANDEIYILDRHLNPVPVGVAGELCIGGAGLAHGYLNQPEQTAERFIRHPFSSDPAARIYRTGDLARFLPDGNVEFLGRVDHQVKIRGFRVEPAEIEAALKAHPAIQRVAIIPFADKSGERRIAAYLVTQKLPSTEELRAFLLQTLPEYMVPSAFIRLDALPLTQNGKLDALALPSPDAAQAKVEREFKEPATPEEEKMAAIWKEVLRIERVSTTDSFFDLGGHSLLATQIISRVRNTFRVQLPLPSFLETPTIEEVVAKIRHCPRLESEEEEMARLLAEIEGLSEQEAQELLAAELSRGSAAGQ